MTGINEFYCHACSFGASNEAKDKYLLFSGEIGIEHLLSYVQLLMLWCREKRNDLLNTGYPACIGNFNFQGIWKWFIF